MRRRLKGEFVDERKVLMPDWIWKYYGEKLRRVTVTSDNTFLFVFGKMAIEIRPDGALEEFEAE